MDAKEFEQQVREALLTYIADEELYDDDAQLVIDPSTMEVTIADGDDDIDDALDRYSVMDLLRMDADGAWLPDDEAIASLVADYQ